MNTELIKFFGVAVSEPSEMLSFETVNTEAVKKGYIVHPDACTESVMKFINEINVDYNSTFYKTFDEVLSKSRFELFLDQIMHYATTYGTDFQGEAWVPNENYIETKNFVFDKYTVIKAVSTEEMYNKCLDVLYSGIALKQATMCAIVEYVCECFKNSDIIKLDVDAIKNREALVVICHNLGIYPTNAISLFRYIVFDTTNESLLIKNRELITKIKFSSKMFDFNVLNTEQIEQLSTIFFRFKPLFLAFKNGSNSYTINKIRRLAEKNHKPLASGLLEKMLTADAFENYKTLTLSSDGKMKFEKAVGECTNFKLVRLIQLIKEKTVNLVGCIDFYNNSNGEAVDVKNMYIVRNGKVYFKDTKLSYTPFEISNIVTCLSYFYDTMYNKLVSNLKENIAEGETPTYIPFDALEIACPVSEKNFIGNYPNGTRYKLAEDNVFGIFWKGEWGTNDFDLSFSDVDGNTIAWNRSYYSRGRSEKTGKKAIVYSGDMTMAQPHATECMKFTDEVPNGIFSINRFNGQENSKFEMFMAQTKVFDHNRVHLGLDYMVDPNTIVFKSECVSDKAQKMLGIICDKYLYLSNLSAGSRIIATFRNAKPADVYNIYVLKSKSVLYLYDVLKDAGYKEVTEEEKDDKTIDFRNASKADIIALFS